MNSRDFNEAAMLRAAIRSGAITPSDYSKAVNRIYELERSLEASLEAKALADKSVPQDIQ